jgi:malonate transporter and related proteins
VGSVLEGFATIGVVIGVGTLLAHLRILDLGAQQVLSRLSFFVASPALIVTLMARTDVSHVLGRQLVATVCGVVVPLVVYVVCARVVWQRNLGDTVIGGFASAYVNAGNLGLPVAAYVLGDATYVVPTLLLQLCVLTPIGLALLDHDERGASSLRTVVLRPLTTPLTLAMLIGLLLSVTSTTLPEPVSAPLVLIGGMAVPSMLVAYGVSLRLGGGFGSGGPASEIALASVLKLLVQPLVATLAGATLGLTGHALLAVAVVSALPTAQNVFTYAIRYDRGRLLARDTILVTTTLCVPVTLVIAAVLG